MHELLTLLYKRKWRTSFGAIYRQYSNEEDKTLSNPAHRNQPFVYTTI